MTICPNCGQMHQGRELEASGSVQLDPSVFQRVVQITTTDSSTELHEIRDSADIASVLIVDLPWMPDAKDNDELTERLNEIAKLIRDQYDRKAGAA